jgi:hypothetical protein
VTIDAGRGDRSPSSQARQNAQEAARSTGLRRVAAAGLVGYAAIHLLVAWLAWSLAWLQGTSSGPGQRATDSSGALALVAESPSGEALLWGIAVGLAGLCVWQAVELLRHHRHLPEPGKRRRTALLQLVKTVGTAVFYGYLAFSAARTALGHHQSRHEQQQAVAGVLGWPGGQVIVTGAAVVVSGIGVYMAQKGIRSDFADEIPLDRFGPGVRTAVLRISQLGFTLKGVALLLVGVVVAWAGVTAHPSRGDGLDGALRAIAGQAFGRWMLTVIAIGLAAFAVYCLARARHPVG